jgi:hypothetical protein
LLFRVDDGLDLFGSAIVDSEFDKGAGFNNSQKFHEINEKLLTQLDVSAFWEILMHDLLGHRLNKLSSEDLLCLPDKLLSVFNNLLESAFFKNLNKGFILQVSYSEKNNQNLLIFNSWRHKNIPNKMGQFLGCTSIVVVLDSHQFLDCYHCMLLEIMIHALFSIFWILGRRARVVDFVHEVRLLPDLLERDVSILLLFYLSLFLLDVVLLLENY